MTPADALGVPCPRCLAPVGGRCNAMYQWKVWRYVKRPHAARLRAAEAAAREGEAPDRPHRFECPCSEGHALEWCICGLSGD